MRIAEWIIDNLSQYGNSLVPNNLIKLYGIRKAEKEIAELAGYPVLIEERMIDNYDLNIDPKKRKKPKKDALYIATRI